MTAEERKGLLNRVWLRYREEFRKLSANLDLSWHEYLDKDERLFAEFKAEEADILHQK